MLKRPNVNINKTGALIVTLAVLFAVCLGTLVLVVGSRSNQAARDAERSKLLAAQAQVIALQTKNLLHERIALRAQKDEIIQGAFERSCEDTNKRFSKLLPLERVSRVQVQKSVFFNGHEQDRAFQLHLIDQVIAALQPIDCTYHIVQTNK